MIKDPTKTALTLRRVPKEIGVSNQPSILRRIHLIFMKESSH